MKKKIFCAIDNPDLEASLNFVNLIKNEVYGIKLGLEFFIKNGPENVKKFENLCPIFLDLKLHDIPNTIKGAINSLGNLHLDMLTIHALGGFEMMHTAGATIKELESKTGKKMPQLLAVTLLTSLDKKQVKEIGINNEISDQVLKLAELSLQAGIKGIVCAPTEIESIKKNFGNSLLIVTPGIRPNFENKNSSNYIDDQTRIMTHIEASKLGADYLVIGRPITQSENPVEFIQKLNYELV